MEVGRGVHPFVEILLLNVGMSIDVDDANVFGGYRCQSSDGGETDGMVSGISKYDRE